MQAAQKDGRGWWTWGANLGNLIDAISAEKPVTRNLQPPIWMSVYFLSVSVQIWEASRKAVVFRSLVDCVERFINMCFFSASFGSFFQRDFFARPFVMARQVRAWWLVTRRWGIRWQRGARTAMRQDLRGTDVTTNDCVMCWAIQLLHLLTRFVFINHSWRPPTMPKFSLRPVETRFWSILGQLKSPQETPACWWVIVLMSALPPHTYLHPATRT